MAISAYVGLPGSGKSYGVVENVIAPALNEKRSVYTNIPMNTDECLNRFGMAVTPFQTQDIIYNENWWTDVFQSGSIIVIDECWRLWPSGLNTKNARDSDKSFLAEHRHMVGDNGLSTEIVLVTQNLSQIANFVRVLVETTFWSVKQNKLNLTNRYRIDVYFGAITGSNPPVNKRTNELHGKYRKETFALYQSQTLSKTDQHGSETGTDGRSSIFTGFAAKSFLIGFILLFVFVFWMGSSFYTSTTDMLQTDDLADTQPAQIPLSSIPKKTQSTSFLSFFDSVHYIGFEKSLLGSKVFFTRYFQLTSGDSISTISSQELEELGYTIKFISNCAVHINGTDFSSLTVCNPPETIDSTNIINSFTGIAGT